MRGGADDRGFDPLIGRRRLLTVTGVAGTLLALGACGGSGNGSGGRSTAGPSPSSPPSTAAGSRPWALRPAGPDLALPAGFEYTVLATTADGTMPPNPDGMACVQARDGTVRLVRNHERSDPAGAPLDPATAYDATAPGGTTTAVLAPDLRSVERTFVSLSGTLQNCAGGVTPAGTWLSCEETNEGPDQGRAQAHGYVFEVDPSADGATTPTPLRALGRFLHEAVAVDPVSGVLYLTEDNGYDSGLYRFTPTAPGLLTEGGTLEMLAVVDRPGYDTAYGQQPGTGLPVTWVPIADPDPSSADTDPSAVFNQGLAGGGARFKRLEGCCLDGPTLYVAATEAGDAGLGQVWALDTARGELRLTFEPAEPGELFGPDNVALAPGGAGLVVCEDNGNGDPNHLAVLSPAGELRVLAENIADTTELAGPCVSPDGSTLFVNVYGDEAAGVAARTVAIWGPWEALTAAS